MALGSAGTLPEERDRPDGVHSLLDTDLYKLTMQSAILRFFPHVDVTYKYTNRTPEKKFTHLAFTWLQQQLLKLGSIVVSSEEISYLEKACPYLSRDYLAFLSDFRLRPTEQVSITFHPVQDESSDDPVGDLSIEIKGTWLDTILYEIPLLALTSEAYFKYVDTDWNHSGQRERAREKSIQLLQHGCKFSEFGSRRRRDYRTHDLVIQGIVDGWQEAQQQQLTGKLLGTSNVHFAMKYGIPPVGTVAHEWFMGIAALTSNYQTANEKALECWVGTFGEGVLGVALTDTFGTRNFLQAFKKPCPRAVRDANGLVTGIDQGTREDRPSFASVFTGTRQDSGDPVEFVQTMRNFYDEVGIKEKKMITFSDSLNIERCFEYQQAAEAQGLDPGFGIGTFFTNDFAHATTNHKSTPLNIVIKLSSAAGNAAVKISDNLGKNTGDQAVVDEVKQQLGYIERNWAQGDEARRWDR